MAQRKELMHLYIKIQCCNSAKLDLEKIRLTEPRLVCCFKAPLKTAYQEAKGQPDPSKAELGFNGTSVNPRLLSHTPSYLYEVTGD